jgi:hypothetical protein
MAWLSFHQSARSANPIFAIERSAAGVSISVVDVVCPDTGTLLGMCQVAQSVEQPGIVQRMAASAANPNRFALASILFKFPWGRSLLNSAVALAGPSRRQSRQV